MKKAVTIDGADNVPDCTCGLSLGETHPKKAGRTSTSERAGKRRKRSVLEKLFTVEQCK